MFYIDFQGSFRYNEQNSLFGSAYVIEYLNYASQACLVIFDIYHPIMDEDGLKRIFILITDTNGDDVLWTN